MKIQTQESLHLASYHARMSDRRLIELVSPGLNDNLGVRLRRREILERLRDTLRSNLAGDQRIANNLAFRQVMQRGRKFLPVVTEDELELSSLLMPNIGSKLSRSMQTPTTTTRALAGAAVMIESITPGTPTHSKITAGRSAGPGSHGGNCGAFDGSL